MLELNLCEPEDFPSICIEHPIFCHFLKWENAARLFFNFSDVIFATLVKFCFVGFYSSLVFLLKPFTYPIYASKC